MHSALGVGTTFTFQMPFLIDKEAELQTDEEWGNGRKGTVWYLRFILVEDDKINMEIAQFYLTDHGAQVAKATNGQEAVALLAASVPDTYDVVLMDLQMPVMGGLEAYRRDPGTGVRRCEDIAYSGNDCPGKRRHRAAV